MSRIRFFCALGALALAGTALGCNRAQPLPVSDVARYPIMNVEEVLTRSGVALDTEVTHDGNGALRVESVGRTTVRLFETGDLDLENARLIYQAMLRSEGLEGRAYLEMWCRFPGQGEYFSRALETPLSGTVEWIAQETPFFLKRGENPDNVRLNLVIEGTGTVWIDDVRLIRAPLG